MACSSSWSGARFSRPSTCLRVQVWPAKKPMFGAMSSERAYSSSGHGWSPLCSDAMIVVMPWRVKFSASGCSWISVSMCAWLSMKPGPTMSPLTSTISRALLPASPLREMATMRSPRMPTSAA